MPKWPDGRDLSGRFVWHFWHGKCSFPVTPGLQRWSCSSENVLVTTPWKVAVSSLRCCFYFPGLYNSCLKNKHKSLGAVALSLTAETSPQVTLSPLSLERLCWGRLAAAGTRWLSWKGCFWEKGNLRGILQLCRRAVSHACLQMFPWSQLLQLLHWPRGPVYHSAKGTSGRRGRMSNGNRINPDLYTGLFCVILPDKEISQSDAIHPPRFHLTFTIQGVRNTQQ